MPRNSLLETGATFKVYITPTRFEPTTISFVNEHQTGQCKLLSVRLQNKWLWVQISLLSLRKMILVLLLKGFLVPATENKTPSNR